MTRFIVKFNEQIIFLASFQSLIFSPVLTTLLLG